jgi:galactonate dehydratase
MKIAEVEPLRVGSQMYVRVRADDGLVGLGQSAAWAYPEAVRGVLEAFRPHLVGQDPLRIEHHWHALYRMGPFRGSILGGALSAVDIALWDIKGQRLGVPIWELLGGRTRDKIRLHLLMGGADPPAIHAAARGAAEQGFTAIKFDPLVAGYQDMSTDALVRSVVEMVAAAREAVGPDVDIILEMHRKLSPVQAVPVAEAVAQFHPLFFEDPVQIDSIQSQAEIARRVSVAVANGERLHSIWEFRELLCAGGTQFVRPDVGLAGGLSQTRKIAAIAESFHAGVALHNFLGPVLTAASAHLDVAIPNFAVQEYTLADESPAAAVFDGVLRRTGGYLEVPERPGLGVTLDAAKAAQIEPTAMLRPVPLRADGSVAYAV